MALTMVPTDIWMAQQLIAQHEGANWPRHDVELKTKGCERNTGSLDDGRVSMTEATVRARSGGRAVTICVRLTRKRLSAAVRGWQRRRYNARARLTWDSAADCGAD